MKPHRSHFKLCKILPVLAMLFLFSTTYGQKLGEDWKQELTTSMEQFLDCIKTTEDNLHCSTFIGESLTNVYDLDDFYSEKGKRYLMIHEISQTLIDNGKWTLLGRGYDQEALLEAQNRANANKAVVAIYNGSAGVGHIALILPGEAVPSGTWGFNVPNSASFFLHEPGKSYVGKGLSYAFGKSMIKDVLLYSRNY